MRRWWEQETTGERRDQSRTLGTGSGGPRACKQEKNTDQKRRIHYVREKTCPPLSTRAGLEMHLASCDVYSNHTLVPELLRQSTTRMVWGSNEAQMAPLHTASQKLGTDIHQLRPQQVPWSGRTTPVALQCSTGSAEPSHQTRLGLGRCAATDVHGSQLVWCRDNSGAYPSAGLRTRPLNRAEVMRCGYDRGQCQPLRVSVKFVKLLKTCLDGICCFRSICNLSIFPLREELEGRVPPGIHHCHNSGCKLDSA